MHPCGCKLDSQAQNASGTVFQGKVIGYLREELFGSQRDDGINTHGTARGNVARGERHKRQ
jgi:hypothetical protein